MLERNEAKEHDLEGAPDKPWPVGGAVVALVVGLVLLAAGGNWLIGGSVSIATRFNVPEAFIAVTVIALGTSLPELATSLVAAFRGNADIAVGNILGSNIFNVCGVLGLAALARPLSGAGFHLEISSAILLGVLLLPFLATGRRLVRWEGALLVGIYVAIIAAAGFSS
jgi:cation:H+ antiporter